jgi:transcriptional regulator with XRE-family HTH domain
MPTPFGKQLARWRLDAEKTQAEVAAAVGVSQQTVSTWESDGWPSPRMVLPLAEFLGVPEAEMAVLYLRLHSGRSDADDVGVAERRIDAKEDEIMLLRERLDRLERRVGSQGGPSAPEDSPAPDPEHPGD